MNKLSWFCAVALLATSLLSGCATATIGADFDSTKLAQLERGKTTVPQASALLGRTPDTTLAGASGALAHTWRYIESTATLGRVSSANKSAMLIFNTDGTFQRVMQLTGYRPGPK
jgi:outer membrane protein assembly factor BamE (lipoprotein component of BamABCDE complex)